MTDLDLDERAIEEALIREVIADEGEDPDHYEIVWTDEETLEDYHLRRLSPTEVELRRREEVAVVNEALISALRQFGYSAAALEEMDFVEKADRFVEEMAELNDTEADQSEQGGEPR